jgi:hypothetical protein
MRPRGLGRMRACHSSRKRRELVRILAGGRATIPLVPLATSSAKGRTAAIASATLSGVRPPDRMTGAEPRCSRASSQANVSPVPPGTPRK